MSERAAFKALVGIEIDLSRSAPELHGQATLLQQSQSDQMLSHLAADLGSLLPGIGKCRLLATGALYDQCQLLRPGLPVFEALKTYLPPRSHGEATPGLTAVGVGEGVLPGPDLEPDQTIPPGVLRVLPLLIEGPASLIEDLAGEMEHRFLSEGQVSAHTASWLESAFDIAISHARFMTLTDLNAMFRLQLENFGFLPLWELIDGALNDDELSVSSNSGIQFELSSGTVTAKLETFDHWATSGGGYKIDSAKDRLAQAYADMTLEFRQYVSTLDAHRIPLHFECVSDNSVDAESNFLCEASPLSARADAATVTEHSWPDVGTIAITVATADGLRHYYPLKPGGLNDIHRTIRQLDLENEGISYSGRIDHDPKERCLVAGAFESA